MKQLRSHIIVIRQTKRRPVRGTGPTLKLVLVVYGEFYASVLLWKRYTSRLNFSC